MGAAMQQRNQSFVLRAAKLGQARIKSRDFAAVFYRDANGYFPTLRAMIFKLMHYDLP